MKAPAENYRDFMDQALEEAARLAGAELKVSKRVVSAHSGGGLTLRNAIKSGNFKADKIELLDANYGDWGMVMTNWAKQQTAGKVADPAAGRPFSFFSLGTIFVAYVSTDFSWRPFSLSFSGDSKGFGC
jgi:hypothetical protein